MDRALTKLQLAYQLIDKGDYAEAISLFANQRGKQLFLFSTLLSLRIYSNTKAKEFLERAKLHLKEIEKYSNRFFVYRYLLELYPEETSSLLVSKRLSFRDEEESAYYYLRYLYFRKNGDYEKAYEFLNKSYGLLSSHKNSFHLNNREEEGRFVEIVDSEHSFLSSIFSSPPKLLTLKFSSILQFGEKDSSLSFDSLSYMDVYSPEELLDFLGVSLSLDSSKNIKKIILHVPNEEGLYIKAEEELKELLFSLNLSFSYLEAVKNHFKNTKGKLI